MIGKIIGALVVVLGLAFGIYALSCWEKVPAGNVGIKVYLLGSDKGVDTQVLSVGRQWVGWQQELYLYPTFTQNDQFDVSFNDNRGLQIKAPVGISFHVDPAKAALLFQKYREPIDQISQTVILRYVQDAFSRHASDMTVEDISGPGKAKLIAVVQADVYGQLDAVGLVVEKLNWLGQLELPPQVQASLTSAATATQNAIARENMVATEKAQADIVRTKAQGEADAALTVAAAEAKAIQLKGDALKQNPGLIAYTYAQNWKGEYPATLMIGDSGKNLYQIPLPPASQGQ
jgi:regulator of protease activity HflC (stomatin/prohibitin superfamily)